jgi:hypothetical protein
MRASPYNLFVGADHLDAWVRGTLPLGDMFDVSAVFLQCSMKQQPKQPMISWEPADWDTAVGVVTLTVAGRQREPLPKPSQKGVICVLLCHGVLRGW